MVDNTWLEQYRSELHSLRDAGDVKAIRKKNMELNNRLEYVKDDAEREIFLAALYETEDILRECRTEEKMRNGLTEYKEKAKEEPVERSKPASAPEVEPRRIRMTLQQEFELECDRAEEGRPESILWLARFYERQGEDNKMQRNSLLKMAAEKGNKEAMRYLARVYRDGDGCEKNPKKAHWYYDKLESEGDKEAAREHCLLYYEEERYDRVYPYVKAMIEEGENFDPENNWTDACLLVIYTVKGIHYGDLQSNLENLTEMRSMIYRVERERKRKRTDRDTKVLYTMECLYMKALFRAGRYVGACHSIPGTNRALYVYAILQTALEAGGTVQKEVWEELCRICKDEKEDESSRDALMCLIIDRLFETKYYEEMLYFADRALGFFKETSRRKDYWQKYLGKAMGMKVDAREKFRCYESVVKGGGINTAYMLAKCYYNGEGCEQNFEKAKVYYELGSQGYFGGDCRNGIWYCERQFELKQALEVLKTDNFAQAVDTIERLAKHGYITEAHYEYGRILEQGRYRKQNEYGAFTHYAYAAAEGHEEAKKRFAELKRRHKDFWEWFEDEEYSYDKVGGGESWRMLKNL